MKGFLSSGEGQGLVMLLALALVFDPVLLFLLVQFAPWQLPVSAVFAVIVWYSLIAVVLTVWFVVFLLRPADEPEEEGETAPDNKEARVS
jgi:fatty acid desaturase